MSDKIKLKLPEISRRGFLKLGAASAGAAALMPKALKAMEQDLGGRDLSYISGAERQAVPYTCLTCNIEDGGVAYVENGRVVKLEGNMEHPNTRGKLCAKGNSGFLHIYDPDRITQPLLRVGKRGEGKWRRISYDEAAARIAAKLREVIDRSIAENNPAIRNEIVFKWGRNRTGGACERFMHALGSNSVINHTNICESSKKVGLEPGWGPDIESCDWANTKYIINFGSNVLETAYFMNPNAQRLVDGVVGNKAKLVSFDVRMSNTSGYADEAFFVTPGTDGLIALAMAHVIMNEGLYDEDFISDWTNVTPKQLIEHLKPYTPEYAEKESGVPARDIARIAREFAIAKPATTFSYRGPCKQLYGAQNEAAIQLLNVITGNVEEKGGYCLPRGMGWPQPQPVPPHPDAHSILHHPPEYPIASHEVSTHAPYMVMKGEAKVSVWFTYYDNPVYTYPSAHVWEAMLKDEKLVPFFVSFSPYMSETTELADLIMPDVTYLERHDPESMPSGLYPCLSIRQPVVKPLAGSQEFRQNIIDIIHKVDPDGSLGIRKYFNFKNPEEWMRAHFDNIPGLKEVGGYDFLKKHGVWPIYGEVDKKTARIVDKNGNEVEPEYRLHMKQLSAADMAGAQIQSDGAIVKGGKVIGRHIRGRNYIGFGTGNRLINVFKDHYLNWGFDPLPTYKRDLRKDEMDEDDLFLTTYKVNVHTQSRTASLKYLAELYHKNPAWINPKTAARRGIKDGDLVRIESHLGYMVTRAHVTEGIQPRCIAVSTACGHTAYGRLAQLKHKDAKADWAAGDSADIRHNVWWDDVGVHPNRIIQLHVDPMGASQAWFHTVVKVSPAKAGDKYGDVVSSIEASIKDYENTLRFSVIGDMHPKMHQELAREVDFTAIREKVLKQREEMIGGHHQA